MAFKPRIRPLRADEAKWWMSAYSISLDNEYQCEGRNVIAKGKTPEDAYRQWLSERKQIKGQGLQSARWKRQEQESRIKARENRRLNAAEKKIEIPIRPMYVETKPWYYRIAAALGAKE